MLVSFSGVIVGQQRRWTVTWATLDDAMLFEFFCATLFHFAQGFFRQRLSQHACHDILLACFAVADRDQDASCDVTCDTAAQDGCSESGWARVV